MLQTLNKPPGSGDAEESLPPPIDTEEAARRLARVIVSDIQLYNGAQIAAGQDISLQIKEGFHHFVGRVAPQLHEVFHTVLAERGLAGGKASPVVAAAPQVAAPVAHRAPTPVAAAPDSRTPPPEASARRWDEGADPERVTPRVLSVPPLPPAQPEAFDESDGFEENAPTAVSAPPPADLHRASAPTPVPPKAATPAPPPRAPAPPPAPVVAPPPRKPPSEVTPPPLPMPVMPRQPARLAESAAAPKPPVAPAVAAPPPRAPSPPPVAAWPVAPPPGAAWPVVPPASAFDPGFAAPPASAFDPGFAAPPAAGFAAPRVGDVPVPNLKPPFPWVKLILFVGIVVAAVGALMVMVTR